MTVCMWNNALYHGVVPEMSVIEFIYSFLDTLLRHLVSYNLTYILVKDEILTADRQITGRPM